MNADAVVELIERATAALRREDLTSAGANALRVECGTAAHTLAERIEAIHPRTETRRAGPVRAEVLATGDDAAVQEIEREFQRAEAQRERLIALRDRANAIRVTAQAREASEGLPSQLAALAEALDRLEAAHRAVRDGEQAVHQLRALIAQARHAATAGGQRAPAASVELARRLIELHPAANRFPHEAASDLGVDLRAQQQQPERDEKTGAARWAA